MKIKIVKSVLFLGYAIILLTLISIAFALSTFSPAIR